MGAQCKFCDKILANNYSLNRHFRVCKTKNIFKKETECKEEIEKTELFFKKQLDIKELQIKELQSKLRQLEINNELQSKVRQLEINNDKTYFIEDIIQNTLKIINENFIVIKKITEED